MRRLFLVLLAACAAPTGSDAPDASTPVPPGDARADAAVETDARPPSDAPVIVDAGVDAAPPPDAHIAACDTVTGDRIVQNGDVVTTCLSTDADVDTYRFTAPPDEAGGLLRFRVDFTQCQLSFALWLDSDPSYPLAKSDDSFDTIYTGQLDHNLVQIAAPSTAYSFVVKKRRPFMGSCDYTLTVGYTAIADPYEPNHNAATAKTLTVGTPATAYMACVTPMRIANIASCEDVYRIELPPETYEMSMSLPSAPTGINPCFSVTCVATGTSTSTYSYFDCHPAGGGGFGWYSLFNVTTASSCYMRVHGSSQGHISTSRVEPYVPPAPKGADKPYTLRFSLAPDPP